MASVGSSYYGFRLSPYLVALVPGVNGNMFGGKFPPAMATRFPFFMDALDKNIVSECCSCPPIRCVRSMLGGGAFAGVVVTGAAIARIACSTLGGGALAGVAFAPGAFTCSIVGASD